MYEGVGAIATGCNAVGSTPVGCSAHGLYGCKVCVSQIDSKKARIAPEIDRVHRPSFRTSSVIRYIVRTTASVISYDEVAQIICVSGGDVEKALDYISVMFVDVVVVVFRAGSAVRVITLGR